MQTKNIKQSIGFSCTAHEIYEALMDSKEHSSFTGDKASISREVGGDLSAFSGSLKGKNIELIPDEKIVQEWRFDYKDWPEDYFSKVTINLKEVNGKTRLRFFHTGIPEQYADDIADGWRKYYWEPMKKNLGKS
jgi:activator of HSP90 ATPase